MCLYRFLGDVVFYPGIQVKINIIFVGRKIDYNKVEQVFGLMFCR